MTFLKRLDLHLLFPALSISIISFFLLASSSHNLFLPQAIFTLVGLLFYFIVLSVDYELWPKFQYFFYLIILILLIVIFFFPQVRGTHRWIDFGVFILQPSEILKPLIILFYSSILAKNQKIDSFTLFKIILTFLPVIALIFLQPDLGNAIIYLSFFLGLMIIAGLNIFYLMLGSFSLLLFLPIIWLRLLDYQRQRLFSFINPRLDPLGAGYNAIQAVIAIGSGGLLGLGLGRGSQSRLLFLPEYQTDFIFAALVESLGLLGGIVLLVLYFLMLWHILQIALNSNNLLGRYIAIGIFCQIFSQVIINIGMNIGILPITGITLPLLSYGGSSIVSTYLSLGLINAIVISIPRKLLVIR